MLAVPLLWVGVLASAAGAIYSKHRARELFVELERLNSRARQARDRMGPAAARAERLVDARVRRERGEHEAARWRCRRRKKSSWCRHDRHVHESGRASAAPIAAAVTAAPRRRASSDSFRWRANFLLGLLVCGALGLVWRAVELQLVDTRFLAKQGDARFSRVAEIAAHRGTITDRYGEPLAVSTPVDSVWANPKELALASDQLPRAREGAEARPDTSSRAASPATSTASSSISRATCSRPRRRRSRRSSIPGVYLMREYRRYYPAGEVAGHVLGFTNVDDAGQEGLELAFDHWLAGEDGAKRVIQDRYGRIVQNVESIRADAPGPRPRAVDRPAHPVPRVSRAEGRDPRAARARGLGGRARRGDRRSAGDGQPARLQPERPRAAQRRRRIAIAR